MTNSATTRISTNRRQAAIVALFVLLLLHAPVALAVDGASPDSSGPGPEDVVRATIDEVLAVLSDPELDESMRRQKVEAIAFDVFDFTTMSKLVLARNWKRFSKDQKRSFVDGYKALLARSYGSRLDRLSKETVDVLDSRVEPRGDVTVRTKIVGGKFHGTSMNYRLRHRKQRWRVIDVIIEGVSLVANYRSQFAQVLSSHSPDQLIEQLATKNFEPPDEVPTVEAGEST